MTTCRRELESHFSQRIKEVEARFSGDQEAVSERFQADVHNLEQHYQSELQALSKLHTEERTKWEVEMEASNQEAENQRKVLKEALQLEKEAFTQEFFKEREDFEQHHKEEMEALRVRNQQLQNELESFISAAQTKEIELSRQLNELHDRLQENLDAKDQLLAQSERKALEVELLLRQAANDFEQERTDLQASLSDLESRHVEALNLAETQLDERRQLLEERDRLKAKVQEVEQLLRQAAEDFDNERLEMQCTLTELEEKLKEAQASVASLGQKAEELEGEIDSELDAESSANRGEITTTESFEICDEKADIITGVCESELPGISEDIVILCNDFEVPEDDIEQASCDLPVFAVPIPEETDEELARENCDDANMHIPVNEVAQDVEAGTDETVLDGNDADNLVQTDPIEEGDLSANTDEKEVEDDVNDEVDNLGEATGKEDDKVAEEIEVAHTDEGTDVYPAEPDMKDSESTPVTDSQETDAEVTAVTENEVTDTDISTDGDQLELSKDVTNAEPKENVEEGESLDGGVIEMVEGTVEDKDGVETGAESMFANATEPEGEEADVSEVRNGGTAEEVKDDGGETTCTESEVLGMDVADVSVEIVDVEVTVITDTQSNSAYTEDVEDTNVSTGADVDGMGTDNNEERENVDHNEAESAITVENVTSTELIISETEAHVEHTGPHSDDAGVEVSDSGEVEEIREVVGNMRMDVAGAEVDDMSEVVDKDMSNVPAPDPDVKITNTKDIVIQVTEDTSRIDLETAEDIEPLPEDIKMIEQVSAAVLLEKIKELEKEGELVAKLQEDCALALKERDACVQEILELQDRVGQCQDQTRVLANLQAQYKAATEDNQSLQQQVSQLQQRNNELEILLEVNSESLITGQEALVENCDLKSEISTMIEQAKDLEIKALELTDLQIRYEECVCENVRLADHNEKLENRVVSLESKMHIIQEFHDQHSTLLDEIGRMREENAKLSAIVHELEKQDDEDVNDLLQAMQQESSDSSGNTSDSETFLDLNSQMEAKIQAVSDLEECCSEFEKQNAKLRRALTELQDKSFQIRNRMQAHR